MSSMINTNIASINAQNNLNKSQSALQTSLQRLSSGLRINSAKDDAAGLAISQRMTSQINGLDQASRNANDGISLAQTAEGSLSAITDNLQRIRTLSLQSANATNSASDRSALNAEVQSALAEIGRVAETTQFNGLNLLDGTFTDSQFQVGANANQTIKVSIGGAKTSQLGAYQYNNTTSAVSGTALASGDLTINGVNVGESTSGSADDIVNAINSVTNETSVTASATSSIVSGNVPAGKQSLSSGDMVINGTNIGVVSGDANLVTQSTNVANAINLKTSTTGVTATVNTADGKLTLASSTGKTIEITSTTGDVGATRTQNATGLTMETSAVKNKTDFTFGSGAQQVISFAATSTAGDGNTVTIAGHTFTYSTTGPSDADTILIDTASSTAQGVEVKKAFDAAALANTDDFGQVTVGANNAGTITLTAKTNVKSTSATDGVLASAVSAATAGTITKTTDGAGLAKDDTVVIDGLTYQFMTPNTGILVSGNIRVNLGSDTTAATADKETATALATAINAQHALGTTKVTASDDGAGVVTTTNDLYGAVAITGTASAEGTSTGTAAALVVANDTTGVNGTYAENTTYGKISLTSNAGYSIAGNNSANAGLATASSTLSTISTIDISSVAGSNDAISRIDAAISQINTARAGLGALQNRFSSTISNLDSSSENISAARSRIQDTDFAKETAALTRGQILQQAGTAMLAQANSLPNGVLALLR